MFWLQYLPVLTIMASSYRITGLTITSPQNINMLKNQSLKNHSASWIHNNIAVSLNDRPTKRQTPLPDVDDNDESNLKTFYDNQATHEYDFYSNKGEAPHYRQVILNPNVVNAFRHPRPYPFEPLHVHWRPHMQPMEIIPDTIPVHHYRKVPFAFRVPKYENVPEPYYVPYKPSPDYTVMDVDVYHPGLYEAF